MNNSNMKTQKRQEKSYPYMTFEELKAKYPDTWVLLQDSNSLLVGLKVHGGKFVYKNKNKNKVILKIAQFNEVSKWSVVYTGEIKLPKNTIICL